MTAFAGPRVRALIALLCTIVGLVAPPAVHAQKGRKCDVDNDNSTEAIGGRLFLSRATDPKMADTAKKDSALRSAVGALGAKFNPNKEFGRDYLLGEALVLYAANPANPVTGPRSAFGYKDDGDQQTNILATADTLLTALARGRPECEQLANNIRQQAYVPLTNAAITAINAGQYDKADSLAQHAVTIYQQSPYVYNVLGGVAVKHNDFPAAEQAYQKVMTLSGSDTTYRKLKNSAMYNYAVVLSQIADATSGSDKKVKGDSAVAAWKAYQQANPSDPNAQAGLTHALQASGDTAAAAQLFADMLANPSKYTDIQLFQGATQAAQANRENDAIRLFQAGLKINPYFGDALHYVANAQFNGGQVDSLMPTVHRLIAVDPNNPDNYRLLAGAFQLRQRQAPRTDNKLRAALGDSILAALNRYEHPKVKMTITKFVHDGEKMQVGGRIENLTDSSKTYTPKFSFVDAGGNVVATADASPVTVPAKGTGTFEVSSTVPGAVAYKYAPLD